MYSGKLVQHRTAKRQDSQRSTGMLNPTSVSVARHLMKREIRHNASVYFAANPVSYLSRHVGVATEWTTVIVIREDWVQATSWQAEVFIVRINLVTYQDAEPFQIGIVLTRIVFPFLWFVRTEIYDSFIIYMIEDFGRLVLLGIMKKTDARTW